MEEIFRVTIKGGHKQQSGISFREVKLFPNYPKIEDIQEFFDDEMKNKSKQFKQSFMWEISVEKIFIPKM